MNASVKTWSLGAAALLVLFLVGGFLIATAGVIPIKASSPHFALTRWLLEFGKRRSVATHTLVEEAPDLAEPWLVQKGAGHFEGGCSPCHGSPVLPPPLIAGAMRPQPPSLGERIAKWDPKELVYIVEHGIKFTGMPSWPAPGRRDEVHAVVAFLLELPDLDAAEYLRLVYGELPVASAEVARRDLPAAADLARARCARCHGSDGLGRETAAFPRLAGQQAEYLFGALAAYASGARRSGIMQPIAAELDEADWRALAEHYAGLTERTAGADGDVPHAEAATIERGRAIARDGIPRRGVPSCADCHGPGSQPRNPAYPRLAGQFADYLELQLVLFASGSRGGSPFAHLMDHVAPRLRRDEMRAVAAYYASLPAER